MKIVHLCLGCFFPDNYSYQENMLPKFHKQQGFDVEVIASLITFDENGNTTYMEKACVYQNEYDIKVTRLNYRKPSYLYHKMKRYTGTYSALKSSSPDILFIHGCQFMDIDYVVRYIKKHPGIRVYVDNHADFSNSATNWISKNILHRIIWKRYAWLIEPYVSKFYGVLPARVDFLTNIYKLPPEKCELLVMGADDNLVENAAKPEVRKKIRQQHHISDNDFLIVTGGKIDKFKKQTILLMKAIRGIENCNIKLIVFGSISPELKSDVSSLTDGTKVQTIGWIQPEDSYRYFAAADLVVFPGRHSVFWEQVVAQGIPMLCKKWNGTTHVDVGGNVEYLEKDSVDEIISKIKYIIEDDKKYQMMMLSAKTNRSFFLYGNIAKRSIELE